MKDKYFRNINVLSVYDGDTITAHVDLGFGVWAHKVKFRLLGIDTPEIRTRDSEEKIAGYRARDYLRTRVDEGDEITIQSVSKGKYGRWLGVLYIDGVNINDELVSKGYAEPYLS